MKKYKETLRECERVCLKEDSSGGEYVWRETVGET